MDSFDPECPDRLFGSPCQDVTLEAERDPCAEPTDRWETGRSEGFPGAAQGTGVILANGSAGGLLAFWCLEPDDLIGALAAFPREGGRPWPVLRVHRSLPGDGSEMVEEVRLPWTDRERSGDVRIPIPADHRRYQVELGLSSEIGGWLLLARSNGLDNVCRVGFDLRSLVVPLPSRVTPPPGGIPPSAEGSGEVASAEGLMDEPQLSDRYSSPVDLGGTFPLVRCDGGSEGGGGALCPGPVPVQRELPGRPVCLTTHFRPVDTGPVPSFDEGAQVSVVLTGSERVLTYGQAPGFPAGLHVEAELRITGQAVPLSLIDLFGHSFQVGPGGRFQLTLRVFDHSLLRRALELNPPPELARSRQDRGTVGDQPEDGDRLTIHGGMQRG